MCPKMHFFIIIMLKIVQNSYFKKENMTLPAFLKRYLIIKVEKLKIFSHILNIRTREYTTCYWLLNENKTAKKYAYIVFIKLKSVCS